MNQQTADKIIEKYQELHPIYSIKAITALAKYINSLVSEDAREVIDIINKYTYNSLNDVVLRMAMEITYGEDKLNSFVGGGTLADHIDDEVKTEIALRRYGEYAKWANQKLQGKEDEWLDFEDYLTQQKEE
ncbi:unnamed protein product [marine sediment metagenome]|uniref:Uncharacterized protein n=1 Tax=marine sediment metagenome TaxID=412755 RepID=X0WHP8_9ZZZZ